eukprot:4346262-Pyramimonas_sp.AAC.1
MPPCSHRIPRQLFESETCQQQLKLVCQKLNYVDKSPPRQIELHKWTIREVAAFFRDRQFQQSPESNAALLLLARQVSRA